MRTIIAVLSMTACCLAAEIPYQAGARPQSGLLVLPLPQAPVNGTNSTTTPRTVGKNNNGGLEAVNAQIMERLRLEQGSERGVYHVYSQDGRLQRVQYTTAPVSAGQQSQQTAANSYNQQYQTPEILSPESAGRRGVYFVQVPQERLEALQATNQQNSAAQVNLEQNNQVNVRYLPLQASEPAPRFNAQYNQEESSLPVVRYLPIQLGDDNNQYNNQYRQQQEQGSPDYVASVQYSQVEPITGPVYSYSPQALTRILRYAPAY